MRILQPRILRCSRGFLFWNNLSGLRCKADEISCEKISGDAVVNGSFTTEASVLSLTDGEIQVDDPEGNLSSKTGLSSRFDFDQSGTKLWETSGLFNKDLLIGPQGVGQLELHGDSRLLLGDDLGLANSGSGTGQEATLIMDGTSLLAVGSGAEIGKVNAVVSITIGGNLNLAYNEYMGATDPIEGIRPGVGRLEYVITANGLKPIIVGGAARISNGTLKLVLDVFVPPPGTRYTLLRAKSIDGPFKDFDVTKAPLPAGQFWDIASTGRTLTATVSDPSGVGPLLQIETNEDSATLTWSGGQLQVSPYLSTPFVDIEGATSPYVTTRDTTQKFYRLRF